MQATTNNIRNLIPLTRWGEKHQHPPIGGLRYLVFNAHQNGFDSCIVRIGKRVLIDEEKYFEWVDNQNSTSLNPQSKGGAK